VPLSQTLATNLIRCGNTIVTREAACVFYGNNTFAFLGDHNWDPAVEWLQKIGGLNRSDLASLKFEVATPRSVWQRSDGSRIKTIDSDWDIYPRNPNLLVDNPSVQFNEGEVENINPAIETMMRLLGPLRSSKRALELHMLLPNSIIPGMDLIDDDHKVYHYISMDLQNLIEKFGMICWSR
jgi:hypothetical protein